MFSDYAWRMVRKGAISGRDTWLVESLFPFVTTVYNESVLSVTKALNRGTTRCELTYRREFAKSRKKGLEQQILLLNIDI